MVYHSINPNYYKTLLIHQGQHWENQCHHAKYSGLNYRSKYLLPFPVGGLSFPVLVMSDLIKSLSSETWLGGSMLLLSRRSETITWFHHIVFSFCLQREMSQLEGHSFSLGSRRLSTWNRAAADPGWTQSKSKKQTVAASSWAFQKMLEL